jgi:sporulation protein YabP
MEINQIVKLENRKSLLVTGVKNVKSFDSKEFILDTRLGILEVEGKDLTLGKMDLSNEEVLIKGSIDSLEYSDTEKKKESLVKRFFK